MVTGSRGWPPWRRSPGRCTSSSSSSWSPIRRRRCGPKWAQCVVVFIVAFVEMLLRLNEVVYAPFYALCLVGPSALIVEAALNDAAAGGTHRGRSTACDKMASKITEASGELRHGGHTVAQVRYALTRHPGMAAKRPARAGTLQDRGHGGCGDGDVARGIRRHSRCSWPSRTDVCWASRLPTPPGGCCPKATAPLAAFAAS